MPAEAKEKIDSIVNNSTFYKNKIIWKQKFYYTCDYVASHNFCYEHDVTKDYVNIHQETMAKILGVDNRQIATMLRDCLKAKLFKTDGKMVTAVKAHFGSETKYDREGKSFGYQFLDWNDLIEVEVADNRSFYQNVKRIVKRINEKYDKHLAEYNKILSSITIDESDLDNAFKNISKERKKKKSQKENYRNYYELLNPSKENNKETTKTIPFDGVIVPIKIDQKIRTAYSYQGNSRGGVIVPCRPCKFEVVPFDKSTQRIINRCKRDLFIVNNGFMIATRPKKDSRVYCTITNLNKALRTSIRLDGKKIVGLDIKNCQPLLAAIVIRKYWLEKTGNLPEDVIQYQSDCEAGNFYNYIMDELLVPEELRAEFKIDFFGKVFFSMVLEKSNLLKDIFIRRYPSCWEAICNEKGGLYSKDYNEFAKRLQKIEAGIIFDHVNVELIKRGIKAFNIFDSIYVNNKKDLETAKQLIIEGFNLAGVNPKLKIEYEEHLTENSQNDQLHTQNGLENVVKYISYTDEEKALFSEFGKPDWWQSPEYFNDVYGDGLGIELYEGQFDILRKERKTAA